MMPGSGIVQIAWVVGDLDQAIRRFHRAMGIGPFLVIRNIEVEDLRHRGVPARTNFSAALGQAGPLQIELIEQHDSSASVYRDMYGAGEEGFHHVAFIVPDVAARVEHYRRLGCETAAEGKFGGAGFAYVDTRAELGHMVELIPDSPAINELFAAVRDASSNWDGVDPIREMS